MATPEKVAVQPAKKNSRKNSNALIKQYAAEITIAWQKSVQSIIEVGRLLNEAKAAIPHGDWHKLVDKGDNKLIPSIGLPFSERTAQKLMRIANHSVLSNPTHVAALPASYATLDLLASIPPLALERAIINEEVHPKMERSDVAQLPYCRMTRLWPALDLIVEIAKTTPVTEIVEQLPEHDIPYMSEFLLISRHRSLFNSLSRFFADMAEVRWEFDVGSGIAQADQTKFEEMSFTELQGLEKENLDRMRKRRAKEEARRDRHAANRARAREQREKDREKQARQDARLARAELNDA